MELKKIEIRNFRSIKSANIDFEHNCMILLGKNEAGKSNILRAIAAVFGQYQLTDQDKRKRIGSENILDEERYVRATIVLQDSDLTEVMRRFESSLGNNERSPLINLIPLSEFVSTFAHEFCINLTLGVGNVISLYPQPIHKDKVDALLQLLSRRNNIKVDYNILLQLQAAIFKVVVEIYNEKPISCLYWQYSQKHLLPSRIDIDSFINDSNSCVPLERIFQLCGRDKIHKEFENAKAEDGDYYNLLQQVSDKATETFHQIWPDFKDTSIQLIPGGNEIAIKLFSKAKYSFEDRSDGFKKFISILLMLSTQARVDRIRENDLILIDEPDQSLYPTSARFLRDELLEISKKAKIVYSTHSEYMIDSANLSRHLLIEKKDDITIVNKVELTSPFANDELLRRAIGTSIFSIIRTKNIVFEGYFDKTLFDRYLAFTRQTGEFESIGKIFLWGISGVEAVTSILQSADKKFIVVADSDSTSKDKRGVFAKANPECKEQWLAYGDVHPDIVTMEDFFKTEFLRTEINKIVPAFTYDANKPALTNIEKAVATDKDKKQAIKGALAMNFKRDDVKDQYQTFLDKLREMLSN